RHHLAFLVELRALPHLVNPLGLTFVQNLRTSDDKTRHPISIGGRHGHSFAPEQILWCLRTEEKWRQAEKGECENPSCFVRGRGHRPLPSRSYLSGGMGNLCDF